MALYKGPLMSPGFKPSLKGASPWLVSILRIIDSTVVAVVIVPLVLVYIGNWSGQYETLMLLSFFVSFVIFQSWGLYQPWRGLDFLAEMKAIVGAWVSIICVVLFLLFIFKVATQYSRVVLVGWFFLVPLVLFAIHGLSRKILRILRAGGKNIRSAVIVGAGPLGLSLENYIGEITWAGIRVVGFFDDVKTIESLRQAGKTQKPVLGTVDELAGYLQNYEIDFVYIALPMRMEKKIRDILISCRTMGARIFLVPDLHAFRHFNSRIQRLGDVVLLNFNPDPGGKRLFDIAFSLLVILFTLPLTGLIAILIKLQDGGPVFYGHRRIAAAGRAFYCLKFRTMRVDADKKLAEILEKDPAAREEWEKTFKLKKDPRVTWLGRLLRKTSMDELPQFINVLRGEMSVVGARPIVQKELSDYYKENGGLYCSIKPGITGPWQIGKRSDTEDYQERVALDTWYILNRSLWLDIRIILKTVTNMFRGKGAY